MTQDLSARYTQSETTSSRKAILLNGPPASGKTVVGEGLVRILDIPLLSLDTVKEALFNTLGTGDREYNRSLSRASIAVIWSLIASFPENSIVIVDAWFGFPPYDRVLHGLQRAGVGKFVEIWCQAPGEVLAKRYLERVEQRHQGHPGKEYATELIEVASRAAPMGLGAVLTVDTTAEVDISAIARWIANQLNLPAYRHTVDNTYQDTLK